MNEQHLTAGIFAETLRSRGWEAHAAVPGALILDGVADSRQVKPGDLFVGFRGEELDGNAYLEEALERGATAVIGERMPEGDWPDRAIAVVDDSRAAVAALAHAWLETCGPRVVGITGTVGKTTAKELTAAVLRQHFSTHWSKENFNSREGLPLALASLRRDHDVSVLEMAMDSPGEIAELCTIAPPDAGIVLNVGLTHVSKLGSIEAIQHEKLSLVRSLRPGATAVVNADDPRVAPVADELTTRVISFGESERATLRRGPIEDRGLEGCRFTVAYDGQQVEVTTPLPGTHVVPAALAAMGAALALGLSLEAAAASVASAEADGRMRIMKTAAGVTIIDDRYNSSPASLEGALRMLGTLEGRRIAFLGVMAELGDYEEEEHARIGRVAARNCDVLAAVGDPCKALVQAARDSGLKVAHWYGTKEEAAEAVGKRVQSGDIVLVKASRSQAFEQVLPILGGTA